MNPTIQNAIDVLTSERNYHTKIAEQLNLALDSLTGNAVLLETSVIEQTATLQKERDDAVIAKVDKDEEIIILNNQIVALQAEIELLKNPPVDPFPIEPIL